MHEFYIVDKKNISFEYPWSPEVAVQDGILFSFYLDGKTCSVFNRAPLGVKGSFAETEDYNFCEVEVPTFYA